MSDFPESAKMQKQVSNYQIEKRQTKDIDFSDASYELKYNLEYKYYLDRILASIPKECQRFYTGLRV